MNLRKTRFRGCVNKVKAMVTPDDIVIGHSMGGLIVQKIAEKTTIRGCIAICPAPPRGIKLSGIKLSSSLRYLPNIIIKKPFKLNFSFYTKYLVNGLGEKETREAYEDQGEESAIVNYEIAMKKIAVDESKVKCPLFFIATKDDRACPSEMVEKIAGVKDDEETERRCPRCGEKNSVHAENCSRCNQILDYKRLMDEVEKKKDMSNEIIKLNKQVSHLLHGFDGCYFKDGKSTPIYETEAWQLQLKRIMREHYLGK